MSQIGTDSLSDGKRKRRPVRLGSRNLLLRAYNALTHYLSSLRIRFFFRPYFTYRGCVERAPFNTRAHNNTSHISYYYDGQNNGWLSRAYTPERNYTVWCVFIISTRKRTMIIILLFDASGSPKKKKIRLLLFFIQQTGQVCSRGGQLRYYY